jgi:uncharacterized protein YcbK (DUF882 family)
MIREYPKGSSEPVSEHFLAKEFDCECKRPSCDKTLIDDDLVDLLEALRGVIARPLAITSGFRCQGHHDDLTNSGHKTAKFSPHLKGMAVDVKCCGKSGYQLETAARKAGFRAVGRAKTWVHVDTRGLIDGRVRAWFY